MAPDQQRSPGRRGDVLRVLREDGGPMGIVQIAERLDVHPNTVRFHLQTLVDTGQVERSSSPTGSPGRPSQLFTAAPGMDPTGPRRYQVVAEVLVAALAAEPDAASRAIDAGRRWGQGTAAAMGGPAPVTDQQSVDALVDLLDGLGFAPEPIEPAGPLPVIGLHHCPFLELAGARSEVVCPIHLGIMRGALESWGAPVTVDRLEPFARPDLCTTHLTPIGAS